MPLAALVGVVSPAPVRFRPVPRRPVHGRAAGASWDHEAGHLRSLDNLKRTAMRLAPDWLAFSSAGRQIERAWAIAAEEEADDHAVAGDRSRSLDLAGALLKASRLPPVRLLDRQQLLRRIDDRPENRPVVEGRAGGARSPRAPFAPTVVGFLALGGCGGGLRRTGTPGGLHDDRSRRSPAAIAPPGSLRRSNYDVLVVGRAAPYPPRSIARSGELMRRLMPALMLLSLLGIPMAPRGRGRNAGRGDDRRRARRSDRHQV